MLEKISVHLKCGEYINNIKAEKEKLDEFINDNIEQGNKYFLGKKVKDKIPNILCNIENNLDNIVLKIYEER